jgi:DNA-binding response OmpR family regulator
VTAANGADAIKKMCWYPPDILVVDCYMQPIGGVELTRLIRKAKTDLNPMMPIIMITGHGEADLVSAERDAGVNEFLVKPITTDALYTRIRAVTERPRPFVRGGGYLGPDRRRCSHDASQRHTDASAGFGLCRTYYPIVREWHAMHTGDHIERNRGTRRQFA